MTGAVAAAWRALTSAAVSQRLAAWLGIVLAIGAMLDPPRADASTRASAPGAVPLSARYCDRTDRSDPRAQDRMLRFAGIVRDRLSADAGEIALISRSGVDLDRFATRFSHAGVAIRGGEGLRWSVRQLYYACDEGRPRLFDQGIAGFLFNEDSPGTGYVSIVMLPPAAAGSLVAVARDDTRALRLLAGRYSANAYPFSTKYQNCNQWVAELIAAAWGGLADGDDLRARAQAWLAGQRYEPTTLSVDSHWLKFASGFVPLLYFDDHPEDERLSLSVRLSLPDSIEAFVRAQVPGARRIELCHAPGRVVIRQGWSSIDTGCVPREGDEVIALD